MSTLLYYTRQLEVPPGVEYATPSGNSLLLRAKLRRLRETSDSPIILVTDVPAADLHAEGSSDLLTVRTLLLTESVKVHTEHRAPLHTLAPIAQYGDVLDAIVDEQDYIHENIREIKAQNQRYGVEDGLVRSAAHFVFNLRGDLVYVDSPVKTVHVPHALEAVRRVANSGEPAQPFYDRGPLTYRCLIEPLGHLYVRVERYVTVRELPCDNRTSRFLQDGLAQRTQAHMSVYLVYSPRLKLDHRLGALLQSVGARYLSLANGMHALTLNQSAGDCAHFAMALLAYAKQHQLAISIGVAHAPDHGCTVESLYPSALHALGHSVGGNRYNYVVYSCDMQQQLLLHTYMENITRFHGVVRFASVSQTPQTVVALEPRVFFSILGQYIPFSALYSHIHELGIERVVHAMVLDEKLKAFSKTKVGKVILPIHVGRLDCGWYSELINATVAKYKLSPTQVILSVASGSKPYKYKEDLTKLKYQGFRLMLTGVSSTDDLVGITANEFNFVRLSDSLIRHLDTKEQKMQVDALLRALSVLGAHTVAFAPPSLASVLYMTLEGVNLFQSLIAAQSDSNFECELPVVQPHTETVSVS